MFIILRKLYLCDKMKQYGMSRGKWQVWGETEQGVLGFVGKGWRYGLHGRHRGKWKDVDEM